jgi:hypothetical protein
MLNIIYTDDTDSFRLLEAHIFGEGAIPPKIQEALIKLRGNSPEVMVQVRFSKISRPVVPRDKVNEMRRIYNQLKETLPIQPTRIGIVTYSQALRNLSLARFDGERSYDTPEGISLFYLPLHEVYPSFYSVRLEEKTKKPKDITEALKWIGVIHDEKESIPQGLADVLMSMQDDTFGDTKKRWNIKELLADLSQEPVVIITDTYIFDAIPGLRQMEHKEYGFRL